MYKGQGRTFVDLFSGCGGLSLGLCEAGWRGRFAIERDSMAFETFARNFLQGKDSLRFAWPDWLEQRPWQIDDLLKSHEHELSMLAGQIDLVAGGPPCQGYSFAGRRNKSDPRNQLFRRYVRLVESVRPKAIVLENVPGMRVPHGTKARDKSSPGPKPKSYLEQLVESLHELDYVCAGVVLNAAHFGVPQHRPRLIVVGIEKKLADLLEGGVGAVFANIEACRLLQLQELGLSSAVAASDALCDLEIAGKRLRECDDPESRRGYEELTYKGPRTRYQRLMHGELGADNMNSMRLARHSREVEWRFGRIIATCPKGVRMNDSDRKRFGLLKHRVYPMSASKPAPTVTTLPDDVLHYSEPRILTVRECARLQSFPDWFYFCGKFTTGGKRRKQECPRYTQVGNAVPPLMARAVGMGIAASLAACSKLMLAKPRGAQRAALQLEGEHQNVVQLSVT